MVIREVLQEEYAEGVLPAVGFQWFHECMSARRGLPAASKMRWARWKDLRPEAVSSMYTPSKPGLAQREREAFE